MKMICIKENIFIEIGSTCDLISIDYESLGHKGIIIYGLYHHTNHTLFYLSNEYIIKYKNLRTFILSEILK